MADEIDDSRLDELFRIGVDEIYYRKSHRYLTVVADHDRNGAVVWAAEGKKAETLKAFYDQLGDEKGPAPGGVGNDSLQWPHRDSFIWPHLRYR